MSVCKILTSKTKITILDQNSIYSLLYSASTSGANFPSTSNNLYFYCGCGFNVATFDKVFIYNLSKFINMFKYINS